MANIWFDSTAYLKNKLAQLQKTEPSNPLWQGADAETNLVLVLAQNGYVGAEGQERHYQEYGANELVSPNAYFNVTEYLAAKAAQANANAVDGKTDWSSASILTAIQGAGMTVFGHFQQYGWKEGVNPSNAFDLEKYFEAKLAQLQKDEGADKWTNVQQVKDAFAVANLDPISHYAAHGKTEGVVVAPAQNPVEGAEGKTYMLTKGLDNFPGTAGNDTIIGSVGAADLNTFSVLDIINGGAGTDTLKVTTEGYTAGGAVTDNAIIVGANVTNVEIVEVSSAAQLNVNSSAATGVQTLNVIGATGNAIAKAAATTDIAVKLDATTSDAITTQGGKNVSVELANAAAGDTVTVGVLTGTVVSEAAKGDVTVSVTGKAHVAADTTTLGNIAVNGGKTISVTQKATSDASAAATSKANSVTQGDVAITADKTTTEVTVKQDATVAGKDAADTTGGVTESVSVKFGVLKANDSVTVGGLTFTAKVDLTAAEVAAAFANLVDAKVPTVGQDTQGSGLATAKGTYSNEFTVASAFTSAAADGDTVVFTSTRANFDQINLPISGGTAAGSVAPVPTVTQGKAHNATPAGGVLGVNAGSVTITGEAALKTVTIDNFNGASSVNGAAALETLNVANVVGQTTPADSTLAVGASAETLSINLNNFGTAAVKETLTTAAVTAATATVDLNSTTAKTVNVKVEGKSNAALDLVTATSATALNVSGSQTLAVTGASSAVQTLKVTESAGVTLNNAVASLTSVDTTGTTGASTVTIDGGKATYAGGAGVDKVTVSAVTGGVLNKSINLGAGDDTLDLTNAALTAAILKAIPTANAYQGGEGTDTIKLTAANAVELSADSVFAGKIDGFEKLDISKATTTGTVNLANLDNINYVVSANSTAVTENGLVTFQGLTAGQSVTVAGRTVTVSEGASATATEIAAAFLSGNPTTTNSGVVPNKLTVSGNLTGWTAAANSTGVLKFTSTTTATNVATDLSATYSDTPLAAALAVAAGTKTEGTSVAASDAADLAESTAWTLNGLTNGQSYTIAGRTVTANKSLTAAEVAAAFVAGTTSLGNYTVDNTAYAAPTGWTSPTFSNAGGVLTLTNGVVGSVDDFVTAPTANGAGSSPTDAVVSEYVQGSAVGLTIDNLTSGGTLELTATGAGVNVNVKDAATGTADVLNLVANAAGGLGTVKAADVETINISVANKTATFSTVYEGGVAVKVADAASNSVITLDANAAKAVTVAGAGNLTLDLAAANKVATVDASANTGGLSLDLTAHNGVAVTVTGGAGNDVLKASVGTNAKADVLVGGEGNDTLNAGSNGAKLTGGAGNDLFVLQAGTKEVNTYTSILDFQAGDVLELNVIGGGNVTAFDKLTAVLNENTSVFSNFVDAAIQQATTGQAVWFQFKGNAYVVVDNVEVGGAATGTAFENGQDAVIELVGIDLNNASFNSTHATVALI